MNRSQRFTVIELLSAIVLMTVVGSIGWSQYASLQAMHRDQDRKTAINAMHYNLKEVVLPSLKGYPRTLSAEQLKAMDPQLLKDPNGRTVGRSDSEYRYEPSGCNGSNICKSYILRADLELENDFVNRSN